MSGLTVTGSVVLHRPTGREFAFHETCATAFLNVSDASPLDDSAPLVILAPLFADPAAWSCPLCDSLAEHLSDNLAAGRLTLASRDMLGGDVLAQYAGANALTYAEALAELTGGA